MNVSAGLGALEEGDDRTRGAAIMSIDFTNNWISKLYGWGRTYGPVTETSGLISVARSTDVFGSKALRASVGFSALAESTAITYKDYPEENSSFTSTNAGMMLGLNYDIYSSNVVKISASWDSHLFAAGPAVILLVTGRKQIIGVTAGVSF